MKHRPILADFRSDDQQTLFAQIDISGILLDILGDDEDTVLAFVQEPLQFDDILNEVERHPEVRCRVNFEGLFDLAHYLDDSLSRNSPDENIIAAWNRWYAEAMNARFPEAWAKARWDVIADNMRIQLAENTAKMHPEALVPMMHHILESPSGLIALRKALEAPTIDMVEAMKIARSLEGAA